MPEELKEMKGEALIANEKFDIPAELGAIPGHLLPLIFPDLSIAVIFAEGNAQVTHCHRVTFRVTLSPGAFRPAGNVPVKVRVIDEVFGQPQNVGEVMLLVPGAGGSTLGSVEWPMPEDAKWTPDFNNKIKVIVDPDNQIMERNKNNNTCIVTGTCLG
jgi:hypothetical protein